MPVGRQRLVVVATSINKCEALHVFVVLLMSALMKEVLCLCDCYREEPLGHNVLLLLKIDAPQVIHTAAIFFIIG